MNDISHEIPPYLSAPYRRVRARTSRIGIWGDRIFILPHMLVGVFFLFVLMPGSVVWALFGENHSARVTRIWSDTTSRGATHYHVAFTYSFSGRARSEDQGVSLDHYQRLEREAKTDRTVTVRAISVGPLFYGHLIDGTLDAWKQAGVLWLFGSFWSLICGLFFFALYVEPYRQRKLCRTGVPIIGKILSKNVSTGKSTAYYIRYAFVTPVGDHIIGNMTTSANQWQLAEVGQKTTVLYNPGKPRRSVLYDYSAYECIAAPTDPLLH